MINYDEFYVNRQPEHTILSIIIMDTDYPLNKSCHGRIEELQRWSDTCFIFSDNTYEQSKGVNKKKFISLYDGNCFISCSNSGMLLKTIFKSLEYSIEIFQKHNSYVVFRMSSLECLSDDDFKKFQDNSIIVNQANLVNPFLSINRLDAIDYYEFYKVSQVKRGFLEEKLCLHYLTDLFSGNNLEEEDREFMYASWITKSPTIFFKKDIARTFLNFLQDNPEFIGTFGIDRVDLIFPSLIERLRIKYHNYGIEKATLRTDENNKNKEDKQ